MPSGIFLADTEGMMTVPVPAFLIDHPKGKVLFDSGLNQALHEHQDTYFEPLGDLRDSVIVDFAPGQEIDRVLERLDIDAGDITHLVNSHLHFDHAGGNEKIPNAPVVVQRREWDWAVRDEPDLGYFKQDFMTGQDITSVDGEVDLFGDGAVTCIPTYGHTPGHQSLRVRTDKGEYVLTGDACYLRQTLTELKLPGAVYDENQMIESLHLLRDLQARGAQIIFGHDSEFWETVPRAPLRLG
jgi:glyoxylase-like metal-dependent hydrolase (beta-lactamase superfamily II)